MNDTVRHFVCKRCGKKTQDLKGGFRQYSKKLQIDLFYENIDLCDKCFKITTREQKNVQHLNTAVTEGIINKENIEELKRFQTDKVFRRETLEKAGIIKVNEERRAKKALKDSKRRKN